MTADNGGFKMKHLKKCIAVICTLCFALGMLCGCGDNADVGTYDPPEEMQNVSSGTVAENDRFIMSWDAKRAAVMIKSKADNTVWSSTPVDYLNSSTTDDFEAKPEINSLATITCWDGSQQYDYYASMLSVANSKFSSEKIDNGISVTLYFDELEAYISLDFYLDSDSFKTKVDPTKIKNFGNNQIISVTPAPFMCSMPNTKSGSSNSYMVLPSGNGALMYTDARSDGSIRTYTGEVFGTDKAKEKVAELKKETDVSMPFYGVADGNKGLCAIIESAAESCYLDARAGEATVGYSRICARYGVVPYSHVYGSGSHRDQFSSSIPENLSPLVIGYYPVSGSNANYVGISKTYKDYLVKKQGMTESEDNSLLTLKIIGSYIEDDLVVGLPKKKNIALTTYKQAEEILTEVNTVTGGDMIVDMYGYGEGGINATKLAGNYKLTGTTGNAKALKNFVDFTNKMSVKTFFNFDVITYVKKGAGYNITKDSATSIIGTSAPYRQFWFNTGARYGKSDGGVVAVMLSRNKVPGAAKKAVKLTDKYGINGIAFNTLGSMTYSDFRKSSENKTHALKNNFGKEVADIINNTKQSKKTVLIDGAMSFAAAAADIITSCPTDSQEELIFDENVPLYQIVFQGTKSNSVSPINLAINERKQFLKAMETGSGLSFTLIGNYNNELRKQYMRGLNKSVYADNKELIKTYVNESKDYLKKVSGASITAHKNITADVTKTVFDNGVTVYVNYGSRDYVSDIGTVKAQSFLSK